MLKLIQWLFLGHAHKYEQVETYDIKMLSNGLVVVKVYVMRCNSCGKMKKFEVMV